jgi:hypothetical protein
MEEVRYSETSVCFYQTTLRHIPEESTHHSHSYESLKSEKKYFILLIL